MDIQRDKKSKSEAGRMTPEELRLIETRVNIFLKLKSELRKDYEKLKAASANDDLEAERLANRILEAVKPWST